MTPMNIAYSAILAASLAFSSTVTAQGAKTACCPFAKQKKACRAKADKASCCQRKANADLCTKCKCSAATEATVKAKTKITKPQTTCPLMGGKINKKIFADYEGKRVFFCCRGCVGAFKKDPAKYVKQLEESGVTLEKSP